MTEPQTIVDSSGGTHRFPPPLEHDYPVIEGRIHTRSLEAHVVDHCNLTCAECCSLSPLLPSRFTSPQDLARDLELAARVLAPRVFKLVGGEPLLHPELLELLRVVRRSGIAPRVSLTTNGLLLTRMPDACWEELDAMTISRYPRPSLSDAAVRAIEDKAQRFGVRLNWKQQDRFVTMSVPGRRDDEGETARIHARCWIRERCHLVYEGRFYTCTRPMHLGRWLGPAHDLRDDGVELHDSTPRTLLAYLHRELPLQACAHCAGGDAPMVPHRLLSREELTVLRRRPPHLPDAEGTPPGPG
ncbi:radical SAM protein [Paraliomyxa miuraensis]|uniref:radical SAM protein n=1 Tax=Paraliomyxa miuraensis TaxID=376150 RepID=UPI00225AE3B7|nr:radical SAM protein [Paraliomyxa miuraensis]MCX4240438.1 radical SAM protein [Paraliomyxa miuraensis]